MRSHAERGNQQFFNVFFASLRLCASMFKVMGNEMALNYS
jgi:hypothetical protein